MQDDELRISATDLAWVAGILEGEGCFHHNVYKHADGHSFLHQSIAVEMKDLDVLEKLLDIVKMGTIQYKGQRNERRAETWVWRVYNRKKVVALCNLLLPHMSARRSQKIIELLEACDKCGR